MIARPRRAEVKDTAVEIKPFDQTVKNLLETAFYKIPRFQRPYSWDQDNVNDFWTDAVVVDDPDYFIGSFVLYRAKTDRDLFYIVDGQQRLTTITLLLAAVRDTFDELDLVPLASGVQKLIEREDIDSKLRFVLDSETPYPYLQEQIQKYGDKDSYSGNLGEEQQALKHAYEFLRRQIESATMSIDMDSTITDEEKGKAKRDKLLGIRDKVLRLQLISVQLGNEDDAYLIFETLNTRGKDLTVSDLVKNLLTRLLKPTNKGVDLARDDWNDILERFDQSESDIDINRFLHHSWLSRNPKVGEKKLFREIKRTVNKNNAKAYLKTLVADSRLYRQILEPNSYDWTKEERSIVESLRALVIFRVVQPMPMLLSILRAYKDGLLTLRQVTNVLARTENFHAQFTAVVSQRTGGGTASMYSSPARQLMEAADANEKQNVLSEFLDKLRDRVPSKDEFKAAFWEIRFTDENTKQRQVVRYILRRINQHLHTGTRPDHDTFSIEHIAPQNPSGTATVEPSKVGRLGNLIFVPEDLNGKLKNKHPLDKLKTLRDSDVSLDEVLRSTDRWDDDVVRERSDMLAELCHSEVFKV